MIFGKKSLGKVVKKADKELSKVGKMIRQGRCDDALKKLEELYEKLAGFPEEEFRKSLEASSTLFRVLYYAAFTCFKADINGVGYSIITVIIRIALSTAMTYTALICEIIIIALTISVTISIEVPAAV